MKTKYALPFFIVCCFCFLSRVQLQAQGVNNIWMFGYNAGLDFSLGSPVAIAPATPFVAFEGCASVCNAAGSLLFYTNGFDVQDHDNNIMPNGANIAPIGADIGSTSQAAVIVPVPGSAVKYYVFSLEDIGSPDGNLYYSQVDMSLNGGMGDVIPGQKALLLANGLTEKMTVAAGKCGQVWLVVRARNTNEYRSYRIDDAGLHTTPVISVAGNGQLSAYASGLIKFTPDAKKMAAALLPLTLGDTTSVELYDFDNSSGLLSNAVMLDQREGASAGLYYGLCFSPDGTKLYTGLQYPHRVDQYNVSLATTAAIQASRTTVGSTASIFFGDMKNGPDGKLYIALFEQDYLARIDAPNNAGAACGFVANAVPLVAATTAFLGLPNVVVSPDAGAVTDTITSLHTIAGCAAVTLSPALPVTGACLWNTGAATAQITVTVPGIYWVQYRSGCAFRIDSFDVKFSEPPVLSLGKDTTICAGEALVLHCKGAIPDGFVLGWSTGAGNTTAVTVNSAGSYWVKASLPPCSSTDTIQVTTENCNCFVNMPTAFSPNNDGLNDVFSPVLSSTCTDISNYTFQVYNRWGEQVFHSFKPAEGWNGFFRGAPSDTGTYFYLLSFSDYKKQKITKKGDVNLIR